MTHVPANLVTSGDVGLHPLAKFLAELIRFWQI